MNFEPLRKNLIDVIKESQIKIGYSNTAVGLYYPLSSLNILLDTNYDMNEMESVLLKFSDFTKGTLGELEITSDEQRFCIRVPAQGVTYVHKEAPDNKFLCEFISLLGDHSKKVNIDMILDIFKKYSDDVKCLEMNDDEFDYLIYFKNGIPDDFRYCVKLEHGHATYHRFTPSDFEDFGFDIKK